MKSVALHEFNCHYVAEGTGPVLLMVHGFPLDHSMWSAQIESLSADYCVIAPTCAASAPVPAAKSC